MNPTSTDVHTDVPMGKKVCAKCGKRVCAHRIRKFDESAVMVSLSKGVRRVSTPEGARKYGQPIGTVIVRDSPLRFLKEIKSDSKRSKKYKGTSGQEYYVGVDERGRWHAVQPDPADPDYDISVVSGKDEETVLANLDRHIGASLPKPKVERQYVQGEKLAPGIPPRPVHTPRPRKAGERIVPSNMTQAEIDAHRKLLGRTDPGMKPIPPGFRLYDPATDSARLKEKGIGAIPPAWWPVFISTDPDSNRQIRGYDLAWKEQSVYTKSHTGASTKDKFKRQAKVARTAIPKLDAALTTDVHENDNALAVALMRHTGARVGGEKQEGSVKVHGITTIERRHVKVSGNRVTLSFVGKEGKANVYTIDDVHIAAAMREQIAGLGPNDEVFPGVNNTTTQTYLRRTTGMSDILNKDLRTYVANVVALRETRKYQKTKRPKTLAEFKKARLAIATVVADQLQNEAAQALSSYINPAVFDSIADDPHWNDGVKK